MNVYLIPYGDRAYRAAIAETSPDPAAVFLTEGCAYPVEVWWTRHDMNLDRLWASRVCTDREELLELLDFLGDCGHVVEDLWGYNDKMTPTAETTKLFDECYERKMEQLNAAIDSMLED